MGTYLNPGSEKFEISRRSQIYIDKSGIIREYKEAYESQDDYLDFLRDMLTSQQ